jgi:hypothetical protein
MKLLSTWRTLYELRYCPATLIHTAFSAGTVYLLTANSGTRIAPKELRHMLDQETLVEQYLQEIGLYWDCAMNDLDTLRGFMNEVKPSLNLLDQTSIPKEMYIFGKVDADYREETWWEETWSEETWPYSRNHSRNRSQSHIPNLEIAFFPKTWDWNFHHTTSSLTTVPNYISISPAEVPPSSANPLSTHAVHSAPIAIQSQGSLSKPSSFASPWSLLSSEDASGGQVSSLLRHSQPSGQVSSLLHDFQPSGQVASLLHDSQPSGKGSAPSIQSLLSLSPDDQKCLVQ